MLATGGKSLTEAKGRRNPRGSEGRKLPFIGMLFLFLLSFQVYSQRQCHCQAPGLSVVAPGGCHPPVPSPAPLQVAWPASESTGGGGVGGTLPAAGRSRVPVLTPARTPHPRSPRPSLPRLASAGLGEGLARGLWTFVPSFVEKNLGQGTRRGPGLPPPCGSGSEEAGGRCTCSAPSRAGVPGCEGGGGGTFCAPDPGAGGSGPPAPPPGSRTRTQSQGRPRGPFPAGRAALGRGPSEPSIPPPSPAAGKARAGARVPPPRTRSWTPGPWRRGPRRLSRRPGCSRTPVPAAASSPRAVHAAAEEPGPGRAGPDRGRERAPRPPRRARPDPPSPARPTHPARPPKPGCNFSPRSRLPRGAGLGAGGWWVGREEGEDGVGGRGG